MQYLLILTGQKQAHIVYLLAVIFLTHQTGNAWPQTTANLILQARTGAIAVDAVIALTHGEQFLQQRQRFTHGVRIGERAKVFTFGMLGTTVYRQPWVAIGTQKNQRIGFIVAQQNIISGLIQLDIIMFQQ
ncbi:hypothetical protein D3C79_639590 [compost metagenome]